MADSYLDDIDKKLLNLLQAQFPLTREPYADLGRQLGIDGDEVIRRIAQLKAAKIVRQVSAVLDARSLGYQTTLVAMRALDGQLEAAARIIDEHPGVSHGYERDHYFNFWFTLSIPPETDAEAELQQLTDSLGAEAVMVLPAIKLFKIGAYFDMAGGGQMMAGVEAPSQSLSPQAVSLSPIERFIINELQQDLPLVPTPFTDMAGRLGMDVEDFLAQCRSLLSRGTMRRFSAFINHRRAGFQANAMTCWVASPDKVDIAGRTLASLREVSHCYERKTNPLWPYNLFAMIHCHTREACQEIISEVSRQVGLTDYVSLFSTQEFKKVRVKYLV